MALSLISLDGPDRSLGKSGAVCRVNEAGPAFIVEVVGLRDRTGLLKLELYPDTDADFLGDDGELVRAGKPFRRVELPTPRAGLVTLCIRAPHAGAYAVSLLHDRDGNHRFGVEMDGVGFSNNPRLHLARPKAAFVRTIVGTSPARLRIVLNYRHGLFSFRPD